jgi:hypothetical protein
MAVDGHSFPWVTVGAMAARFEKADADSHSGTLFARAPDLRLQDAWRSSTRRISTAGGATRISLKDCIQSAVSSPDPALTGTDRLDPGAQLDLELQRRTTMTAG